MCVGVVSILVVCPSVCPSVCQSLKTLSKKTLIFCWPLKSARGSFVPSLSSVWLSHLVYSCARVSRTARQFNTLTIPIPKQHWSLATNDLRLSDESGDGPTLTLVSLLACAWVWVWGLEPLVYSLCK